MEVFITGMNGGVYRKIWDNGSWTNGWEYMCGNMYSKPEPIAGTTAKWTFMERARIVDVSDAIR